MRGNGVQGEHDVREPDGHHDQQHGGHHALAVDLGEQLVAVVLVRGLEEALGQTNHHVVGLVSLVLVRDLTLDQVARGVEQEQTEHVEQRGPPVDRGRADEDEHRAGDQSHHDAEQEHLLLVSPGHLEGRHDDQEHEQIVHRQGLLGHEARVVLRREARAVPEQDQQAEDQGQGHIQAGPQRRLLDAGFVRFARVEDEVVREQPHDHRDGDPPIADRKPPRAPLRRERRMQQPGNGLGNLGSLPD